MKKQRESKLYHFLQQSNLQVKDIELINRAFTHGSYIKRHSRVGEDNERLEFLGDSVLGICCAEYLYKRFPNFNEGKLTKLKNYLVSGKNLAYFAQEVSFEHLILLGPSEEKNGGRSRSTNLSNTFEAFLGALYLDQGIAEVKKFLVPLLENSVTEILKEKDFIFDYKSELQYLLQKKYKLRPDYTLVKEEGPDHQKIFTIEIHFQGKILDFGSGNSKKEAEQNAAFKVLERVKKGVLSI